jgi:hypothetical protein
VPAYQVQSPEYCPKKKRINVIKGWPLFFLFTVWRGLPSTNGQTNSEVKNWKEGGESVFSEAVSIYPRI